MRESKDLVFPACPGRMMLRMLRRLAILALLFSTCAFAKDKTKVQKQTIEFGGAKRTYYVLIPEKLTAPAPLLLLLHGSGRNGLIMVDQWKDLAAKEGIVLLAPDARVPARWGDADGPPFLHAIIDAVRATQPIDGGRLYIFGHSGGAVMGLLISMMDSEYFAATAVHAGAFPPEARQFPSLATRKIPIKIFVGDSDPFFPLSTVQETRDLLVAQGIPVELTVIPHHTHDYYSTAAQTNRQAWEFLRKFTLPAP